jgi:hypothetical protein
MKRTGTSAAALGLAASLAGVATADVSIVLEQFGVGDHFRPGDPTAIKVLLRSDATTPQPVRIEWEIPDADGDLAVSTRSLVLAPGQPASRWIYGCLPPARSPAELEGAVFSIRVHEEIDGERGRELGLARVSAATAAVPGRGVALEQGLVGLAGSGRLGLEAYETPPPGLASIPTLNETIRIASGIGAAGFPDRWEGLASFAAIVWAGDDPSTRPTALGLDESRALREWIERGGTFVIVLPEAGDPWSLGTIAASSRRNFLADALEGVTPTLRESVPVRELLPALSKSSSLRDPGARMPIRLFESSTLPAPWIPLLAVPAPRAPQSGLPAPAVGTIEGDVFAIGRPLGFGQLVIVGVDLDALRRRALQDGGLPQADCVWNTLLGLRGDSLTAPEYAALDNSEPRRLVRRPSILEFLAGEIVTERIDLAGEAAVGILAALGLFAIYWLLAGPLGFGILKRYRRERLSWVLFVAMAAVFSAIAWSGSLALRQGRTRVVHLTFLDHVARADGPLAGLAASPSEPQFQRAESWFTASLPGYGTAELSIDPEGDRRNLLSSWLAPPGDARGRFPDIARYDVDLDSPGSLEVPARATASTFAASWVGPLDPDWGGLPRIDAAAPVEPYVDLAAGTVSLQGRLVHDLPGPLEDVRIVHVNPWRTPLPRFDPGPLPIVASPGEMPQFGRFVIVPSWPAGVPLDLGPSLYPKGPSPARAAAESLTSMIRSRYYEPLLASLGFGGFQTRPTPTEEDRVRRLDMLSLYSMLTPPPYLQNPPTGAETARVERMLGRRLDLGPWFNRPCLVVIGYLRDSSLPVPLEIDGETPPSEGLTVVRWILPLPAVEAAIVPEPRPAPTAAAG